MRASVLVGLVVLGALAGSGCGSDDVRGPLLETIEELEGITRDEISILEDLGARPDAPSRHRLWRQQLEEARGSLDQLAELRAEIDDSTEVELGGEVGRRALSIVEEIRRALEERIDSLRSEFGRQRIA